jgi:alpha 1,3-mannosyltransferase
LNKEDAENRVELMKANAEGNKGTFAQKQKVGGDVESQQAGDDADGFVQIRNPKRMEEERKKKEKEEKEKKEKEEKAKKEKKEQEEKEKKAKKDEEVNKLKKQAGTYKGDDGEEEEGGDEGGEEEEGDDDKEDK